MSGRVTVEDGHAVIHIPLDDVHGLCVALAPCGCRAAKSEATGGIREKLRAALRVALTRRG